MSDRAVDVIGKACAVIVTALIVIVVAFNVIRLHQAGGATAVLERVAAKEMVR